MSKRTSALALALFVSSILPALAQSTPAMDVGLDAYHNYHGGDIDHINLDSGNLTVSIPLLSYPQRGSTLKLDFALVHNGSGRSFQQLICVQGKCTNGWLPTEFGYYGMSALPGNAASGSPALFDTQNIAAGAKDTQAAGSNPPIYYVQSWIYSADGSSHSMGQTSNGQMALDGSGYQTGTTFVDGGSADCNWDCTFSAPVVPSQYLIATHGGITYVGSSTTAETARIDTDGNYILYGSNGISDTVGRLIPYPSLDSSVSARCPSGATKSVTWIPPGYTAPYTFCYETITILVMTNETVLQTLVLPNGQSWGFQYNEQLSGCSSPYPNSNGENIGDLTGITFPTGGSITYTYTCIAPFTTVTPPPYPYYTTAVASRTVNDGIGIHQWTYQYDINSSGITTTVTDPVGNVTTHAMTSWNQQRVDTYYSGGTSGPVMKAVTTSYLHSTATGFPLFPIGVTTTLDGVYTTEAAYTYCCDFSFSTNEPPGAQWYPTAASYGKVISSAIGDSSTLRQTKTSYLFQSNSAYMYPGLFDLVSQSTTYDGNNNQVAQATYGYDETARVNSGIAALGGQMTTPLYSVYGHLTSATKWLNVGGNNPKTTTSYYDTGEAYQVTDPLGYTTSIYYCTEGKGGSPTSIPCGASTYLGALPTVVSNVLGQQTSFTYRTDTGQLLTTTDPNQKTTINSYTNVVTGEQDTLNRLGTITYADNGQTTIQYNDSGQIGVTVSQKMNSSASKTVQAVVDGLGRESETISYDPSGNVYTYQTYDALGRMYQAWNPTHCSPPTTNCGESSWGYTTNQYDALGRIITKTDSDLTNTQHWSYAGNLVTFTDENSNKWTRTTDALGRLTQVLEPSGTSSTPTLETDYTYDPLNNLLGVTQWGGTHGSSGAVTRSFSYDSLSRLLQADNPEAGWICYGTTTSGAPNGSNCTPGYDADGNLHYKTDARNVVTSYTYDQLNRLLSKMYSNDPSNTPSSCIQYDTVMVGRVSAQWTQYPSVGQCQSTPPASPSVQNGYVMLTAISSYDNVGRVLTEKQCNLWGCYSATPCNGQSYGYDLAGDLTCLSNGIPSTPGMGSSPLTFTLSYDSGGHFSALNSSSTALPQSIYTLPTGGYGPVGPVNWNVGPLSVTQQFNNRLWVHSITVSGNTQ